MVESLGTLNPEQVIMALPQIFRAGLEHIRIVEGLVAEQAPAQVHPLEGGRALTQTAQIQATVG